MKRVSNLICLVYVTLALSGCATLGALGGGLYSGFIGIIRGFLKVLSGVGDILDKLPSF